MQEWHEGCQSMRSEINRMVEKCLPVSIDRQERDRLAPIAYARWSRLTNESNSVDTELMQIVRPLCQVFIAIRGRRGNPWQSIWKYLRRWADHSAEDLDILAILCGGEQRLPLEVEIVLKQINAAIITEKWRRSLAAILIADAGKHPDVDVYIEAARRV